MDCKSVLLLSPANEVWGKAMFLLAYVILFTGRGVSVWGSLYGGGGLCLGLSLSRGLWGSLSRRSLSRVSLSRVVSVRETPI